MSNKKKRRTMTKRVTTIMLTVGTVSANIPFALSLMNKDPVTELGIAWVTGVVAICLGYFIRGYSDSKELGRLKYKKERYLNNENDIEISCGQTDTDV